MSTWIACLGSEFLRCRLITADDAWKLPLRVGNRSSVDDLDQPWVAFLAACGLMVLTLEAVPGDSNAAVFLARIRRHFLLCEVLYQPVISELFTGVGYNLHDSGAGSSQR